MTTRRNAIRQLGLGAAGAAVAWGTPAVLSVDAASASTAQPIQFISSSTAVAPNIGGPSGTTQDLVVSAPAGLQENDLLLAVVGTNGSSTVTTVGTTWLNLGTNTVTSGLTTTRGVAFSRIATASEPATYTFRRTISLSVNVFEFRVLIAVYRYTTGLNLPWAVSTTGAAAASHTFPTITGRFYGWAVRLGVSGPGGAALWGPATSPDVEDANTGNVNRSLVVFHSPLPPGSGTTPTGTTGYPIAPNRPAICFTAAINSQFNP